MVESLKHIENVDTFKDLTVAYKDFSNYKKLVSNNCIEKFKHFHLYDVEIWKELVAIHLKKMNEIVNGLFEIPIAIVDQMTIFSQQQVKHININQTVAVLSAFPIFIHDYYGNKELMKRIE